jgi:hypothetical protein
MQGETLRTPEPSGFPGGALTYGTDRAVVLAISLKQFAQKPAFANALKAGFSFSFH